MASAASIVRIANDSIDTLEAIKRRAVLANAQAKGANRQANRLGTNVSGSRGADGTSYSDPVGNEAVNAWETLERVQSSMAEVKEFLYHVASELGEWAENRTFDDVRRCGEDDCARQHVALGMCDTHYKRYKRAEGRAEAG